MGMQSLHGIGRSVSHWRGTHVNEGGMIYRVGGGLRAALASNLQLANKRLLNALGGGGPDDVRVRYWPGENEERD